jgi:CubicO group peptidase (beta-lactamase class C family)
MKDVDPTSTQLSTDADSAWLQKELDEAHKTIRSLLRQLSKEQQRHAETARAYNMTVANLVEASRENAALERERDMWKARAEEGLTPLTMGGLTLELTPAEISAIRKAMARLHHPDAGGDAERMKAWNAALDPLES